MALYYYDKYSTIKSYNIKNISGKSIFWANGVVTVGTSWKIENNDFILINPTILPQSYLVLNPTEYVGYFVINDSDCKEIYRLENGEAQYYKGWRNAMQIARRSAVYTKNKLLDTIIAEEGTYPDDNVKNDYWYVKKSIAWTPPNINININNLLKVYDNGWGKVNGQLKEIDKIWIKINNELREV